MAKLKLPDGRTLTAPDGLDDAAYGEIVDEVMAASGTTVPSEPPTTFTDIAKNFGSSLLEDVKETPLAINNIPMKLLGLGTEAFQRGVTAPFDENVDAGPEIMKGLAGKEITGKEQFERIAGSNLDDLYKKSQQVQADILGPKLAPFAKAIENIITFGGRVTPADVVGGAVELANDPLNLLMGAGSLSKLKGLGKLAPKIAEVSKVADTRPLFDFPAMKIALPDNLRPSAMVPVGPVQDLTRGPIIGSAQKPIILPSSLEQSMVPYVPPSPALEGQVIENIIPPKSVAPIDVPVENLPPILNQYGGLQADLDLRKVIQEFQPLRDKLPTMLAPPSPRGVPNVLGEQLPENILKHGVTPEGLVKPMGVPNQIQPQVPETFDWGNQNMRFRDPWQGPTPLIEGAPAKDVSQMSFWELLNTSLGERGAVGNLGVDTTKQASRRELIERTRMLAQKTGQNAQELLEKVLVNPGYLDDLERGLATTWAAKTTQTAANELPKTFESQTAVEKNAEAWETAYAKFDEALDAASTSGKKLSNEQKTAIFKDLWFKEREARGLSSRSTDVLPQLGAEGTADNFKKLSYNFSNDLSQLNEYGIDGGGLAQKVIEGENVESHVLQKLDSIKTPFGKEKVQSVVKQLNKSGLDNKQITKYLNYIAGDKQALEKGTVGQPRFDPTEYIIKDAKGNVKFSIPAFDGPPPSIEQQQGLFKLRQALDNLFLEAKKFKPDLDYRARYVHRSEIVPLESGLGSKRSVLHPSFTKPASFKDAPLEQDFLKLWEKQKAATARKIAFDEPIKEANKILTQLDLLDQPATARKLEKKLAQTLGLGDITELRRFRAEDIIKMVQDDPTYQSLYDLRKRAKLDPTFGQQFFTELQDQIMHSFIGLSPKTLMANFLQFALVGPGEAPLARIIGKQSKFLSKSEKAALNAVKSKLYPTHVQRAELPGQLFTGWKKGVSNVFKAPGMPGMKLMDVTDHFQRERIFLAARDQLLKGKNVQQVIGDLTLGEQQVIRDAFRKGGRDAAAEQYGIIRSQRIMNRFSKFDRPYEMSSGVMQHVPFTTFFRGRLSTMADRVKEIKTNPHSRKALTKSLASEMATLIAVGSLLGYEAAEYISPTLSILSAGGISPLPGISGTISDVKRAKTGKGALKAAYRGAMKLTPLTRTVLLPETLPFIGENFKKERSGSSRSGGRTGGR